jgi:hypothetical protein
MFLFCYAFKLLVIFELPTAWPTRVCVLGGAVRLFPSTAKTRVFVLRYRQCISGEGEQTEMRDDFSSI